jgi:hypothetical protein
MAHPSVSSTTHGPTVPPDAPLRVYPAPRPLLDGERIEAYFHPELGWWGLIGRDEVIGQNDGSCGFTRHIPSGQIWDKTVVMLFTGMSTATIKQEAPYVCGRVTVDATKTRYAREGKLKAGGSRMPPTRFRVEKQPFLADWARNVQLIGRDDPYDDPANERTKPSDTWAVGAPDHDPFRRRR